jgi:Uma2 family endonuclease
MLTIARSRNDPKRNGRNGHSLPKPRTDEDIRHLHDLAARLKGKPVPDVRMTEEEFEAWGDESVRAEWINGEVTLLSPANIPHAELTFWLGRLLGAVVDANDAGHVFTIDAQIRLAAVNQRRDPDVLFVSRSRRRMIKETYIDGPPDLVMEIVSPDSQVRDWHDKYVAYEKSGVREYWVVDPRANRVDAYSLGKNKKFSAIKPAQGGIRSKVLRRLFIRPEWLLASPPPKLAKVLKEIGIPG